jgi:formate dehydrogenase major subunit
MWRRRITWPLRPGTNVAVVTALAHVIVTEKLYDEAFIRERCDWDEFEDYAEFVSDVRHSPEMTEMLTGVPAEELRAAARLYATGGNGAIYYGLGVTEHSQGSTTVMGIANLAMLTGNIGRDGVGVNPLRGQNNVQGSCDMGSFPHELAGLPPREERRCARDLREAWGVEIDPEPGLRIPNMLDAAVGAPSRGSTARARISCSRTPTRSMSPPVSPRWNASSSTTCS